MKTIGRIFLFAAAAMVVGCNNEHEPFVPDAPDAPAEGYHFTFDGGVGAETGTRAHWTDEKGSGNLTFNWDYTTQEDMDAGKYEMVMRFKNEEGTLASTGGNNYTYASIHEHSGHPGDAHWAKFQTIETYPNDMLSGEYEGYNVLAVTPICEANKNNVQVSNPDEEFKVTLGMPYSFRQNADKNPDFLRDYMYMYATSTIANGGASLSFRHIPATLRFIITNKRPSQAQLKSVRVEPIKGVMASNSVTVDNEGNLTFSKGWISVETLLSNTYVEKDSTYTVYALVLPLADNNAFEDNQLKFTIEAGSPDNLYLSYVLDADKLASANPNGEYNWVGGKSYTIRMSLGDVLTVDGITASSWEPVDNSQLKTE